MVTRKYMTDACVRGAGEVAIKVETCPMLPLDCPPDFHLMPLNFSLKAFQEKVSLWTPITTPWQVAHGKTTRRVRILGSLYSRSQDPSEVGSLTLLVRRPLCGLNPDCDPFTTKLVLPVYFADSKGNWGMDPCLWPCFPAGHVLWLQLLARALLTMSQLKLPTVLFFFFLLPIVLIS